MRHLTHPRGRFPARWVALLILIALHCLVHVLALGFNPYSVLGVPRNANLRQIKTAYKRLARQTHPDRNPSAQANEEFIRVQEAYEILSDPEKRREYDRTGTIHKGPRPAEEQDAPFYFRTAFYNMHGMYNIHQRIIEYYHTQYPVTGVLKLTTQMYNSLVPVHSPTFFHSPFSNGAFFRSPAFTRLGGRYSALEPMRDPRTRVWLMYFTAENCDPCRTAEPSWQSAARKVMQTSGPDSIGIAIINTSYDRDLAAAFNIRRVPALVGLLVSPSGGTTVKVHPAMNGLRSDLFVGNFLASERAVLAYCAELLEEATKLDRVGQVVELSRLDSTGFAALTPQQAEALRRRIQNLYPLSKENPLLSRAMQSVLTSMTSLRSVDQSLAPSRKDLNEWLYASLPLSDAQLLWAYQNVTARANVYRTSLRPVQMNLQEAYRTIKPHKLKPRLLPLTTRERNILQHFEVLARELAIADLAPLQRQHLRWAGPYPGFVSNGLASLRKSMRSPSETFYDSELGLEVSAGAFGFRPRVVIVTRNDRATHVIRLTARKLEGVVDIFTVCPSCHNNPMEALKSVQIQHWDYKAMEAITDKASIFVQLGRYLPLVPIAGPALNYYPQLETETKYPFPKVFRVPSGPLLAPGHVDGLISLIERRASVPIFPEITGESYRYLCGSNRFVPFEEQHKHAGNGAGFFVTHARKYLSWRNSGPTARYRLPEAYGPRWSEIDELFTDDLGGYPEEAAIFAPPRELREGEFYEDRFSPRRPLCLIFILPDAPSAPSLVAPAWKLIHDAPVPLGSTESTAAVTKRMRDLRDKVKKSHFGYIQPAWVSASEQPEFVKALLGGELALRQLEESAALQRLRLQSEMGPNEILSAMQYNQEQPAVLPDSVLTLGRLVLTAQKQSQLSPNSPQLQQFQQESSKMQSIPIKLSQAYTAVALDFHTQRARVVSVSVHNVNEVAEGLYSGSIRLPFRTRDLPLPLDRMEAALQRHPLRILYVGFNAVKSFASAIPGWFSSVMSFSSLNYVLLAAIPICSLVLVYLLYQQAKAAE